MIERDDVPATPVKPAHPFRPIALFCMAWAVLSWLIYAMLAHHNAVALVGTVALSLLILLVAVGAWSIGRKAAE